MSKVPVSEAAEILGVTKEAVYNRIRRGTLKTFEKDGVKYVVLEGYEPQAAPKSAPKTSKTAKSSEPKKAVKAGEFDVNEFLLSQISELKEQNQNLQADKDRLFREKEQILLIKTDVKFKKVAKFIRKHHSYETPEILALKPKEVFKKYENWIQKSTKKGKK